MRINVCVSAILAFGCLSTKAAEITHLEHDQCSIAINGKLVPGDSARFTKIAHDLGLIDGETEGDLWNEPQEALCLNSPGGSWFEGRLIAELAFKYGISTRVLSGDECLSACSLIFMAGRVRGYEFDGASRYLHVRGRLGFHGPYLIPSANKTYSAEDMHQVSVSQNLIVSDFIRFGSNGYSYSHRPSVSMSLVGEMLSYGPSEMLYVDTIERIIRWNIGLEGEDKTITLNKHRLFQACENILNLPFDKASTTLSPESYRYEPEVEFRQHKTYYGEDILYASVQFSGEANRICTFELKQDDNGRPLLTVDHISACTDNGVTGIHTGSCPDYASYYPSYMALPPSTPILSLAK